MDQSTGKLGKQDCRQIFKEKKRKEKKYHTMERVTETETEQAQRYQVVFFTPACHRSIIDQLNLSNESASFTLKTFTPVRLHAFYQVAPKPLESSTLAFLG